MNKRITCIALFDKESLVKLNTIVKAVNIKLCKVPFIEDDREKLDTLPYHFTFMVWDENNLEKAINTFNRINFNKTKLKIKGVNIKESFNNSWNLYFEIERNELLYKFQKEIFNLAKIEKYNPDIFIPHITIHCDKEYDKIVNMKKLIMHNFNSFVINVEKVCLFKIYPAEKIR